MKRRDVRFIEDLEGEANNTGENFEAILDPNWNESTEEPTFIHEANEANEEINSERERDEEDREEDEIEQTNTPKIPKRGPGRPSLLKTGRRGRPRKLYNEVYMG